MNKARRKIKHVREAVSRNLGMPVSRVIHIGSYTKKTGIAGHSDVDLLFVIAPQLLRRGSAEITSTALLERFRRAIAVTNPLTSIGRDRQAVTVQFARTGVSLDIVPAIEDGKIGIANAYRIPDGSGNWFRVAPLAELRRFKRANAWSQKKLLRTVQLLKLWKSSRQSPIQLRSYYIELLLTTTGIANGARSYSEILRDAFQQLYRRGPTALRDPDGRVGSTNPIPPRASAGRVMGSLKRARDRAARARAFEHSGDMQRAALQWRIVFNGKFPST